MKLHSIFAILMLGTVTFATTAQSGTISPYSQFGYGLLNDNCTSMQRSMGGVGYAMNSGRQINVMNPASYAAIDSLTFLFDMGGNFNYAVFSQNGASDSKFSGGMDYVTMSFPLSKRVGASVGLLPYSTTGYQFSDSIDNGRSSYAGSGGISMLYAGIAYNPFAGLYIGANVSYMFGNITNDLSVKTSGGSSTMFQRYLNVTDWRLDLGMQYPVTFGDNRLTLGATYSPAKNFHGETYGLYYDANQDVKPDTIGYATLKGQYSMPATYGGGINYMWRDRLMIEADFTYQPWKDAKYATMEDFETTTFDNRWKVAAGVSYLPAPRGSYFQRVQYRVGAYYNHDYLMVRGNNVQEIGITAGLGFPIPHFKSIVNLSLGYKHRQTSPEKLLSENYFSVNLGINFNEMWFRKAKIY